MQIERTLYVMIRGDRRIPITVRVFPPVKDDKSWSCAYEIDWPERQRQMTIHGVDAVQALVLALQSIGSELHASRYHANGTLLWEAPGKGYGFPVARGLQDMLVEDDR